MRRSQATGRLARTVTAALLVSALAAGCGADEPDVTVPEPAGTLTPTGSPDATTGSAPPTPADPTSEGSAPADLGLEEIAVEVRDGTVVPEPGRIHVPVGTPVRLTVTSDVADELHVHGYDVTADLAAGEPAVVEFVADQTGLFEAETHESALQLFQLVVE